ncbi:hypothetical protein BLA60_37600 [Actinophytocola xinjiangensis]|uniref:Excreted virulence factor EspC (Type VII ESX diderm) n=1 Tax=Actinophytocola xinjiangensis TaxID=485602 RepID=A0A7Z1AVB2_9PSEU|nr:hypothetical protein [Actinophytocola xinjiangensis]OLF05098.1 hypothetical protein BLA60_37600 [Actinophytocola xinjiangensis]
MDGFTVDVEALTAAGQGITDLMGKLDQKKVQDIDCDSGAVGHDRLAGSLENFCDRWQIGVENLLSDGAQIAQRLLDSASEYSRRDDEAAAAMGGGGGG